MDGTDGTDGARHATWTAEIDGVAAHVYTHGGTCWCWWCTDLLRHACGLACREITDPQYGGVIYLREISVVVKVHALNPANDQVVSISVCRYNGDPSECGVPSKAPPPPPPLCRNEVTTTECKKYMPTKGEASLPLGPCPTSPWSALVISLLGEGDCGHTCFASAMSQNMLTWASSCLTCTLCL